VAGLVAVLLSTALLVAVSAAGLLLARDYYRGPGPGVAERIRAAHDPLVVSVEFLEPSYLFSDGGPGEVRVTLAHDATRDQVNTFWCGVVVPAGGAALLRANSIRLEQEDQHAYDPGVFPPSSTCPPVPDPRPWKDPTPVPPSPPPFVGGQCSGSGPSMVDDCDKARAAVEQTANLLGYQPLFIDVRPWAFPCGEPFTRRQPAETCPQVGGEFTAYVLFVGTAKVAALTITRTADHDEAAVVAFQVPPETFKHFLWPYGLSSSPAPSP
jgi:hypothetical protein